MLRQPRGPVSYLDEGAALVIDEQFAPILMIAWFGKIPPKSADRYFAWQEEFLALGWPKRGKCVQIHQVDRTELPPAATRSRIAQGVSNQSPVVTEAVLAHVVACESMVIRGALTAIGWLAPNMHYLSAATLPSAYLVARDALEREGMSIGHLPRADEIQLAHDPRSNYLRSGMKRTGTG